jgi:peptidoglycan/xylan/chitin deacetylase (PgdA/CDA1 family)
MRLQSITVGFVALTALTTLVHCSIKGTSSKNEKTCSGGQALGAIGLRGTSMQPKTLALTFDDGPGPRTKQLSTYLKNQGIQAAFFVNGRQMGQDSAEILQQLVDDGHLVANHTETHQSLTGTATQTARPADAVIVQEVTETDTKIEKYIPSKRFLFRPPFGDYDQQTHTTLAGTPMNKYVGPILWDVGYKMDEAGGEAADWDCWQDGSDGKRVPMTVCGDLYVTQIKRASRGIVLMHDPYFNELDPNQEGTVDMVMYMVPILKDAGFKFIRVDMVPEIAAQLPPVDAAPDGGGPSTSSGGPENPGAPGENPCP